MDKLKFSKNEIFEALQRSGYLFESEISEFLTSQGFFVENSQVIIDPHTGKSREIDLIAEYYTHLKSHSEHKCVAKAKFVIEIKNNDSPLILLTKFSFSPNLESWSGLKAWTTTPIEVRDVYIEDFLDKMLIKSTGSIFTQYCGLQRKKDNKELMALHPETIHNGLAKITQYCEENSGNESEEYIDDQYWRNFTYIPILLIKDNLFVLDKNENEFELKEVESSVLLINYHYNGKPSMAYVQVVTKKGLPELLKSFLIMEEEIEDEMVAIRSKRK